MDVRSLGWRDSRREEAKEDGGSVYPANGHSADNNPDSSPQVPSGTILADRPASKDDDQLPQVSTPDSAVRNPRPRRLQTPRSESAIEDGRRYLSAYRQYKQNETSEDLRSPPERHRTGRDSGETIESLSVPLGLVDSFSDRVERYQSCAPGLARSLETALTASMERHARDGARVGGLRDDVEDTELVVTEDTPAVHPSLTAYSPIGQLTPEVLRQAARESEADFLCSVIPGLELEGESEQNGQPSDYRSVIGPEQRSSFSSAVGEVRGEAGRRSLAKSPAENGGSDIGSIADATAVARWESLQRLQQQSLGLGNAAEHQLGRALEVCRNLGSWKDLPRAGGTLGREQVALLEALRSNLHGLEEIVSKKQCIDTTVRQETCALGGPAVISSLLDPDSDVERARPEGAGTISVSPEGSRDPNGTAADEVRRRESVTVSSPSSAGEGIGWISGPQLKAFEQEIRSRSSLEIAALESERRKLKGKVDMFQRQIQFLQREKEGVSVNGTTSTTIAKDGMEGNGSGSPAARSMTVANLFDSRLGGDHRQLQASLEAEVSTLRGSLEEKDGLIDALRQALRTAAATQPTAGRELVATNSRNDDDPRAPRAPRNSSAQEVPVVGAVRRVERTRPPQSGRQLPGRARVSRLLDAKSLQSGAGPEAVVLSGAMDSPAAPGENVSREARNGTPNRARAEVSDAEGSRERLNPEPVARNPEPMARPAIDSSGTPPPQDLRIASESELDEEKVSGVTDGAVMPAVPAPASISSEREHISRRDDGLEREGIVSRATMIPGAALRSVWNSARNVGSTVGRRSGSRAGGKGPRYRTESSHAVLIL